ncbi:MAG: Gfo/Idh/MocA family oxidoreductase [Uliginosibacterium sp.]|nr:Gfo/Idh/MocA family oxidoreductase [Uliginosibacterium sp.]
MTKPLRWGILSTANIGVQKVIPAIQQDARSIVTAICSRSLDSARSTADKLGIEKAYGSYEALLADPEIDAIYNPLPNHLHVPWTLKALEAGKHVLCEKPIALNTEEAQQLITAREQSGKLVAEAFMVRFHPQWLRAREIVRSGLLGEVRAIQTAFSYFNDNPDNVRNRADIGGGGLYDIGCYAVATARFVLDAEPEKVIGAFDFDPNFGTDRLCSGLVRFPGNRQLSFACSTQMVPYQRVQIFGSKGRLEVQIPFNAPPDQPVRLFIDTGSDLYGGGIRVEEIPAVDQYTLQANAFATAILDQQPWLYPIEDAIQNMRVIDALFRSAKTEAWESPC